MNNKVLEILENVNSLLLDEESVKEYFHYKKLIEEDEYLLDLNKRIREHQKAMSLAIEDESLYNKEKEIYTSLYEEYHRNPLIINYEACKDEVYSILLQIKSILN